MTSTPFPSDASGADDHPDVAEISALAEDMLSPERSTAVRRHLIDCELCADVRASLEEIRHALGALPGPARMPEEVAGRIDAALTAEALLEASVPEGTAVSRETAKTAKERAERRASTPPHRAHGAARHDATAVSRETNDTQNAASDRPAGRPSGYPTGATGPGRHRPSRRTRRWRTALLAGAGAVVVFGIGGLIVDSLISPSPSTTASGAARGGTHTGADALQQRVQHLLAKQAAAGKSRGADAPDVGTEESQGNNPLAGSPTTIPSCVRNGIDRDDAPLAVDENAPYKGDTRYLVVLPHRGDSQRVDVYVVDRSCLNGETTGPAEVLATHTYPRH